jgi:hypothetical protein
MDSLDQVWCLNMALRGCRHDGGKQGLSSIESL